MSTRTPSLLATVAATPSPGARYLQVTLYGDTTPIPAFVPANLALAPSAGDHLFIDMVGRLPVVRGVAP